MMAALLTNLAMVLVLAASIWTLSRFVRRPALLHGLWLVVLLRLFVPPLLEVGFLPGGFGEIEPAALDSPLLDPVSESSPKESGVNLGEELQVAQIGEVSTGMTGIFSWKQLLVAIWGLGSLLILLGAGFRIQRFRKLLALSQPATREQQRRVDELAARMGLEQAPPLRFISGNFPPLLWSWAGRRHLILPQALLPRLEPLELDTLLLHELAHIRRRDDLARLLEVLSGVVFWWYPVVWWIHGRLRQCEELSCDSWVIRVLPQGRRAYADALLKTLELLNGNPRPVPRIACGVGHLKSIEERLTMIMKNRNFENWSGRQKWSLIALGACALAVFPTFAQSQAKTQAGKDAVKKELQHIDEQSSLLRSQLRELEQRRQELQWGLHQDKTEAEISRFRQEAERLRSQGNSRDAEWAENQATLLQQRIDLEADNLSFQRESAQHREELARALKATSEEYERLQAAGQEAEAQRVGEELRRRKAEMENELRSIEARARDFQERQLNLERETVERKAERLRYLGQDDEADVLLREMEAREHRSLVERRWQASVPGEETEARAKAVRAKVELKELTARLEALEKEGRTEAAAKLSREIEAKKAALEEALTQLQATKAKPQLIKEIP